jgi:hypothetical protein
MPNNVDGSTPNNGSSALLVKLGLAKVFHRMDFSAIFSFVLTGRK